MVLAVFFQSFFFAGMLFYGFSQSRTSGSVEPTSPRNAIYRQAEW